MPPDGHWENYRLLLFDGVQQLANVTLDQDAVNFTFPATQLTPGKLYRAVLRVESGGLSTEVAARDQQFLLRSVLNLHIRHSDETSLSAMWSHAPLGLRDGYFLTIRHGSYQDTREVDPNMRECTFNVLTPGRPYIINVATRSGQLNTSVSVKGRTVPLALRSLSLSSSSSDSLQASWEKPPGDMDSYTLILLQDSVMIQNYSVPVGSSSLLLSGLTPGALYRLQAATVSGGVVSMTTSVDARTSEAL
ncbi:receptor-type tyrosine-protein phosphatase beta-like [Thalassophryne amazonica]|uniref:receptor-type tyrosine-protein phosphatase beta-like n=1 Tax=Thalassophryne amazonica TaxID=390379 RepID=UPI0014723BA1|nr:receptor-type tyrosine-protein phosphatase beta-like [Thalassophryne amazonica]